MHWSHYATLTDCKLVQLETKRLHKMDVEKYWDDSHLACVLKSGHRKNSKLDGENKYDANLDVDTDMRVMLAWV